MNSHKNPAKIKTIIFDAFDVLLSDGLRGTANELAVEMGLPSWLEFFQQLSFWHKNWEKLWLGKINEKQMEKGLIPELGQDKARRFFANWGKFTQKDPQVIHLVEKLKARNQFKLGLLVNTPPGLIKYLEREVPLEFFDQVLFSCQTGMMKPDPCFFQLILNQLNSSPKECLFIDDSQKNIDVAAKLGLQTIRFTNYQKLKKALHQILA